MGDVLRHLAACDKPVIEEAVRRTGAWAPVLSLHFRDPDMNLIEVSNRVYPQP